MFFSERLFVRKLRESDLDDLYGVLSDEEVMRYIEPPFDPQKTLDFIRNAGMCELPLVYAVGLKDSGRVIGHLIWHRFDDDSFELGWILGREHWGKGYASELTRMMLKKASDMGVDIVIECHKDQNITRHIARKYGFEPLKECEDIMLYRYSKTRGLKENGSLFASTLNTRSITEGDNRFLRSDVPDKLTSDEIEWLVSHNVTTVIDLREEAERRKRVCPLESDRRFSYHIMPVSGGNKVPSSEDEVSASYIAMCDGQMDRIIDTAMNAEGGVIYFCNAGKDRTGVVSAVILAKLGFCREYIVEDYLKSAANLREILEGFAASSPGVNIKVITPQRRYMEEFLDWYMNEK